MELLYDTTLNTINYKYVILSVCVSELAILSPQLAAYE